MNRNRLQKRATDALNEWPLGYAFSGPRSTRPTTKAPDSPRELKSERAKAEFRERCEFVDEAMAKLNLATRRRITKTYRELREAGKTALSYLEWVTLYLKSEPQLEAVDTPSEPLSDIRLERDAAMSRYRDMPKDLRQQVNIRYKTIRKSGQTRKSFADWLIALFGTEYGNPGQSSGRHSGPVRKPTRIVGRG